VPAIFFFNSYESFGGTVNSGLSAQIKTSDGWPVAEAVLTLTDGTGQQVTRVTADADGFVDTEQLSAGIYIAIVSAPGFAPVAKTAMVAASGTASLGVVHIDRVGGIELPEPGVWTIDYVHSAVIFSARHLGFSSIKGNFTDFVGRIDIANPIEKSVVHAVIKTDSINTGNKMRDDHLRTGEFLQVAEFPTIEFVGTGTSQVSSEKWIIHGDLSLRGHKRPVDLDVTYLGTTDDPWGGHRVAFKAVAELRRDDFGVSYNEMLKAGIAAIGATVQIELDIVAVQGETLPW
jgi:polyisoprenoid-binding protein YceI